MASLTLRLVKGSTLTFSETDGNFTSLNNEKIERNGSIPFTGSQPFIAGTVSTPGITINGDTNTGIYSPAADQLAITCGGIQRGLFSSSGLTVTGTISGTLSGDGFAITNLNASNINAGTLADALLSSNVPLKNAANTFTANQTINANLTVTGTVSGAHSGNGSGLTSLNASNISSGTLADAYLSSNVALRNSANTFTNNQTISAGASSILTINSSGSPQLRLENTTASANNRNWIVYSDTASFQIRPYSDDYSSSTAALSIARSGVTAGQINTYNNLYVGANQSGIGQFGAIAGTTGRSGFVAFLNPSGGREGYIGFSPTTGGGDVGTIEYIAGRHDFAGRANTRPVSVSFSSTPTFDSSQSNTIYFGAMTANVTSMTISNPVDGAQLQIRFVQDATGGRTVTLPSNVQVSGALNTTANAVTWLVLTYVSLASRWEGTWTKVN